MALTDLPGCVQHYRFSDESASFYEDEVFFDQSAYAGFGHHVTKITGTPAFADVGPNNRRALYLDNTCHWQFACQVPWHGTMVVAAQWEHHNSGTVSFYPMIFGEAVTVTNNASLRGGHFSGNERAHFVGPGGTLVSGLNAGVPDSAPSIMAWSRNQQDRVGRFTIDAATVDATSALAGTANGNFIGFGGQPRVRLGNLNGTAGDTTDVSGTLGALYLFEVAFFQGDLLRDELAALASEWAELEAYYGVA